MIISLHMVNFENHVDTLIEFDKGKTVIKGGSDQGKTTVRRALTYVAFSKPVQGRPCDKSKDSYVTICCSGVPPITRGRTGGVKGKNYYRIGLKELTGEEQDPLKTFKRTVPPEIVRMLDISEVNIQEQFKECYLLQNTAGQVAKTLHKLLGMDLVDKSAKVANSAITAQKSLLVSRKAQIENIKTDIKKYKYIETLESKLDTLEIAIQDYEEIEARSYNLTALLERCRILQQRMATTKIPELVENTARSLVIDVLAVNKLQNKIDSLSKIVKSIDEATKKQRDLAEWLQVEDETLKLQSKITDLQTQKVKHERLSWLTQQLDENQTQIVNINGVIQYNTKKLDEFKKKIKICPACGTPFRKTKK